MQAEIKDRKAFFLNVEDPSIKAQLDQHPLNLFQFTGASSKLHQMIFTDEVQHLTNPSNFLKLLYDEYHENIKLVVSGSSSFHIDVKFKDSLMGRKKMFELFSLDREGNITEIEGYRSNKTYFISTCFVGFLPIPSETDIPAPSLVYF
ncbi:MAG: AAA family ATPase [Candidatus Peribacteria bacterium]|nr:AAA family ATPase [Candidatus Peribacteria bacterium]